jgi:hypothetical protein
MFLIINQFHQTHQLMQPVSSQSRSNFIVVFLFGGLVASFQAFELIHYQRSDLEAHHINAVKTTIDDCSVAPGLQQSQSSFREFDYF